jgi:hypothetical protein
VVQLCEPAGLVTREVAVTLEYSVVVLNAVAFGKDGYAGLK